MNTRQRIEYKLVREPAPEPYNNTITHCEDAVRMFRDLQDAVQEKVVVVLLNGANKVLAFDLVHIGGECSAYFKPSCIMRAALLIGAAAIIVIHNHPSGEPEPSGADLESTKNLQAAAALLEIRVLDHIIIGIEGYYSFQEHGVL